MTRDIAVAISDTRRQARAIPLNDTTEPLADNGRLRLDVPIGGGQHHLTPAHSHDQTMVKEGGVVDESNEQVIALAQPRSRCPRRFRTALFELYHLRHRDDGTGSLQSTLPN